MSLVLVPTTLQKAAKLSSVQGMSIQKLSDLAKVCKKRARPISGHYVASSPARAVVVFDVTYIPERRYFFSNETMEPNVGVSNFVRGRKLTGKYHERIQFHAASLDANGQKINAITSDVFIGFIGVEALPDAVELA